MNLGDEQKIREPIVQGIFYPEDKDELLKLVDKSLGTDKAHIRARSVICPHAGSEYSWHYAGKAFRNLETENIKRVVIIAPVHRESGTDIFLPESIGFRTPLGVVEVETTSIDNLIDCSTNIIKNDIPHLEEHAIEVQLPFLQYILNDVPVVPILIGNSSRKIHDSLSKALVTVFGSDTENTLFVISANMSSFSSRKNAKTSADTLINYIMNNDPDGILEAHDEGIITSCASSSIAAMLSFFRGKAAVSLLARGTSTEGNGQINKLVEYAALTLK